MTWIKKLQKFYFMSREFKGQDLSWHVQDDVADKLTIPNFDLFYWDVEGSKNCSHSDPPFSIRQYYVETT
jgi:hypothetical protein